MADRSPQRTQQVAIRGTVSPLMQPSTICSDVSTHRADRFSHLAAWHQTVDFVDGARLVEAPSQPLQSGVLVGMDDRRVGHVHLGESCAQHVLRKQMILGVGDLPERDPLPRRPSDTPVRVGEEATMPEELGAAATRAAPAT